MICGRTNEEGDSRSCICNSAGKVGQSCEVQDQYEEPIRSILLLSSPQNEKATNLTFAREDCDHLQLSSPQDNKNAINSLNSSF